MFEQLPSGAFDLVFNLTFIATICAFLVQAISDENELKITPVHHDLTILIAAVFASCLVIEAAYLQMDKSAGEVLILTGFILVARQLGQTVFAGIGSLIFDSNVNFRLNALRRLIGAFIIITAIFVLLIYLLNMTEQGRWVSPILSALVIGAISGIFYLDIKFRFKK